MSIFIDIGSHQGQEIEWAINRGYIVHAFEPNPNMKFFLEPYENLATINYAAAWNKDGTAELYKMLNPEPGEDGISLIKEKTNVGAKFTEVPTINIGRYLRQVDQDVEVLKINAEGAEYVIIESILDNFAHSRIKKWLVEDHARWIVSKDWQEHREKVLNRIKRLNIKITDWEDKHARYELLG